MGEGTVAVRWQVVVLVDTEAFLRAKLPDATHVGTSSPRELWFEFEAATADEAMNMAVDVLGDNSVVTIKEVRPCGAAGQAGFAESMAYARAALHSERSCIDDLEDGLPRPDTADEAVELVEFLDEVHQLTGDLHPELMDAARLLAAERRTARETPVIVSFYDSVRGGDCVAVHGEVEVIRVEQYANDWWDDAPMAEMMNGLTAYIEEYDRLAGVLTERFGENARLAVAELERMIEKILDRLNRERLSAGGEDVF